MWEASMAGIRKLGDILPPEMTEQDAQPAKDWLDVPLIFEGYRELKGENGVYMRMVVRPSEDTEPFIIATGAAQVIEVMMYLKANKLFPVVGTLTKVGKAILLT